MSDERGVLEAPAARYRRIGLGLLLLAAAAPYRFYGSFPVVASVSVLDGALLLAAAGMLAQRAMSTRTVDVGDRRVLALLCVLPALSLASALWTSDLSATVRETLSYGEGLLGFVYAVQQTRGVPPEIIIKWLRRFTYVLLVPSILMLLHVPGFGPQEPGLRKSQGDYISYFSRLSHPFIGKSNNLATVLALLVIVLFYWGVTRRDRATEFAAIVAAVAIALTVSRGVIIALLAAGVAHLAMPPRRAHRAVNKRVARVLALALAAVIGGGLALYVLNPDTKEFISGRLSDSNVILRESRLSVGIARLFDRPFLGYGSGALPGHDVRIDGGVHNTYLQQLLAYGVVLGVVAVISLLEVMRYFLRSQAVGLRRAVGLTVLAQLVLFAVESSFEGAVLRVLIYLMLGMLVGLLRAEEGASVAAPLAQRQVTGRA